MKYLVTGINSVNAAEFISQLEHYGFKHIKGKGTSASAWVVDTGAGVFIKNPVKATGDVISISDFKAKLATLDLPFKIKNIKLGFFALILCGLVFGVLAIISAYYLNWIIAFTFAFISIGIPLNILVFFIAGRQFDVVVRGATTVFM